MFKIRSISNNLNTHACIKNPEINSKNCIETKKCTDVKFGGTDEKCGKLLPSLIGTTCIKDPLNEVCKETDLCNEAKYVNSFYKCPLLKVSDPNIKYCEFYSNNNGCKEKIINCEQKTDDATEEICGKLETNDNKKNVLKIKMEIIVYLLIIVIIVKERVMMNVESYLLKILKIFVLKKMVKINVKKLKKLKKLRKLVKLEKIK